MKKRMQTLFILCLIICVLTGCSSEKVSSDDGSSDYQSQENNLEIIGLWELNSIFIDGEWEKIDHSDEKFLYCFNQNGELYQIGFDYYSEWTDGHKDWESSFTKVKYYKKANGEIVINEHGKEVEFTHSIKDDTLVVERKTDDYKIQMKKCKLSNNNGSLIGNWRTYNGIDMRIDIGYNEILKSIQFYNDGSLKIETARYTKNGSFRTVHDGDTLEIILDGDSYFYPVYYVTDGLFIISSIEGEFVDNTTESCWIVLEHITN